MAYTTIDDGSAHFQVVTYTGNNGSQSITLNGNSNLQADWGWWKRRNTAADHSLIDSSRGVTKHLVSNTNGAEQTASAGTELVSFDSNGFTLGAVNVTNSLNGDSDSIVAWLWKANGGTTSSNSDGNITSTVQANTTAGFSIVTFTGNGNNDATIGHGLGTTPAMIITKNRDDSVLWRVWHQNLTSTNVLFLNENFAQTAPSGHSNGYIKTVGSSTYSVYQGNSDTNGVNGSSDDMVAYCFAEKQGYLKIGSYEANNNTDGPFVYTGFKPSLLILKAIDQTGNWFIFDNTRDTDNAVSQILYPDSNAAEGSAAVLDFVSNGVKIRNSGSGGINHSGTYIYMAFAENPFVSSKGVPVTAR